MRQKKLNNEMLIDSKLKAHVAIEAIKEGKTISEIAKPYQVHPNELSTWKKEALRKTPYLFHDGCKKHKSKEPDISRDDIFKEVGVLKVENEFLKKKYRQLYGEDAPL